MNTISSGLKSAAKFLNQPVIKEGVKNIAGSVTFAFGVVEIYDIYQIARGRAITTDTYPNAPKWVQIAHKVIIVCAKISLILSAGVSRPGVFIISNIVGCFFSTAQLNRAFGPNTIFAVNPWHPRHVVSIAAVVLALPAITLSIGQGIYWGYKKVRQLQAAAPAPNGANHWLTDAKIELMAIFNSITSRPVLHLGNQIRFA